MKLENVIQSNKFKNEVHKAGLNILYTAWWLKTLSCKELKEFGLTHEQYNVLRILKGKHPNQMCVKDIAGRMIEKNSNVPRIIDRLVVKKLVKRTQGEHDGRQTVMSLTQAGLSVLESSTKKIDEIYEETVSLTNKDAVTLNELLEKIRENER
ncbi:MAG: MarR family transcriptional regulator [Bacteroidetes bacterium]|nr:MarR family transcriptional regulator [Bacteroidota bacterium]MBS1649140.1 MarR family transcriptional regulator [Bacteroidota bacterium]